MNMERDGQWRYISQSSVVLAFLCVYGAVRSRGTDYMIQEVGLKVLYYNIMRENTRTYG